MKPVIAIALAGLVAFASPCAATHGDDLRTDRVPRENSAGPTVLASWKDDYFTDLNRTAPLRRELSGAADAPLIGE